MSDDMSRPSTPSSESTASFDMVEDECSFSSPSPSQTPTAPFDEPGFVMVDNGQLSSYQTTGTPNQHPSQPFVVEHHTSLSPQLASQSTSIAPSPVLSFVSHDILEPPSSQLFGSSVHHDGPPQNLPLPGISAPSTPSHPTFPFTTAPAPSAGDRTSTWPSNENQRSVPPLEDPWSPQNTSNELGAGGVLPADHPLHDLERQTIHQRDLLRARIENLGRATITIVNSFNSGRGGGTDTRVPIGDRLLSLAEKIQGCERLLEHVENELREHNTPGIRTGHTYTSIHVSGGRTGLGLNNTAVNAQHSRLHAESPASMPARSAKRRHSTMSQDSASTDPMSSGNDYPMYGVPPSSSRIDNQGFGLAFAYPSSPTRCRSSVVRNRPATSDADFGARRLGRIRRARMLLREYGPNENVSAELRELEAASLVDDDIHASDSFQTSETYASLDEALEAAHRQSHLPHRTYIPSATFPSPPETVAVSNGHSKAAEASVEVQNNLAPPRDEPPFNETEDHLYITRDYGYVASDSAFATGELQSWRERQAFALRARSENQPQFTTIKVYSDDDEAREEREEQGMGEEKSKKKRWWRGLNDLCDDVLEDDYDWSSAEREALCPCSYCTGRRQAAGTSEAHASTHTSNMFHTHSSRTGISLQDLLPNESETEDETMENGAGQFNSLTEQLLYATDEQLDEIYAEAMRTYRARM